MKRKNEAIITGMILVSTCAPIVLKVFIDRQLVTVIGVALISITAIALGLIEIKPIDPKS